MKDVLEKYKLFKPGNKKRRANLLFSDEAIAKIVGLVENFKGEVGWHGTAVRTNKSTYTIEDIFVYPQDATPASVDTDQSEYEQWLYTQPNEIFEKMRMHGHSHYNFGVKPSSIDDKHRNGLVAQLTGDMFYIFMIINKEYKWNFMIYDGEAGILYDNSGIDVYLLSDNTFPVSLKDVKVKIARNEAIKTFLADAKKVVNIREDKNTTVSRLICDNDLYSMLLKYTGQDIRLLAEDPDEENRILKFIAENGSEILRLSGNNDSISLVWNIRDVQSVRPDLTNDECMDVLERVKDKHDTSIGVTWDTIEVRAAELYPKPSDAKTYGKFVRNGIAKLVSANSCSNNDCLFESHIILNGHEMRSKVVLCQDIEAKRLYHHWYGGCVATLTVSMDGKEAKGEIVANGAIRAYLNDKEDNNLCYIKDKANEAGFFDMSHYILDDKLLAALLNHDDNEQGFSLQVEDSNWWELFPETDSESVVLSDYSLLDAIGEAVEIFYTHLESEAANESE